MTDLCALDALALRDLIGRKAVSPVELVDACIARVEAVNPAVNAFVTTCFDRARAEARQAEESMMRGEPLGLLHGLPVGIKDLNETEGLLTTYGSELLADYVPKADERLVAAMRREGAIVLGKTNTPEFGAGANTTNRLFGPTRNPFDPERTPGGSSGGGAVALACGMVPLATGSDHGGSLRTPAAYSGISGFRPSAGLIAHERRGVGYTPLPVQGPMGRTVRDMSLLMAGLMEPDERDPLLRPGDPAAFANLPRADLSSLKVAISEDLGFAPVDEGIRATFRERVARFEAVFARADKADPDLGDADEIFDVLRALIFMAAHREKVEASPDKVGPNVTANVELGFGYSMADVARAMSAHTALYRRFLSFMQDHDVLIAPCAAVPPFPVDELYCDTINGEKLANYYRWLGTTYGLTLTSHPVAVIPCGLDATGTPFGIQVCGRRGADLEVLAISAALEAHLATIPETARPVPPLDRLARVELA